MNRPWKTLRKKMPKIFEILSKAYAHAKNHKFLWFFGFFLTGGGLLDFSKTTDPRTARLVFAGFWNSLAARPIFLVLALSGAVLGLALIFILIGICRGALIAAAVRIERKEPLTFRVALRQGTTFLWRIAAISLFANLVMVLLFLWLFVPVFYLIRQGFDLRAFFLAIVAMAIFLPLMIILSLLNIFSANFVGVYNLHLKEAVKSAFDLIAGHWYEAVPLLFMLFGAYFLLFFFSADILSLVGFLAFGAVFLLKSLSIPFILGIVSGMMTAVLAAVVVILLIANAALNVFANIAWTLFFMKIVKANRLPEEPKAAVAAGPPVYFRGD